MFNKIINRIAFWFNWLGQWPLMLIMAIIIVMIFLRIFRVPTIGYYEVIVVFAYFLYVASWPYAGVEKSHVRVLILQQKLAHKPRSLSENITLFLSLCTCVVMVWACIGYGHHLQDTGSILSTFVPIPRYYFPYLMAFSFTLYGVVICLQFLESLTNLREEK